MANIKISELTALTAPADADALVIVDDSEAILEKTKRITYANLKAALTGVGATYGTTGAYTASMPTSGVAAASIIMLGTSSTIIWMYLNTAPPGWKALSTGADSVIGVSGGTGYFNVNGGNADSLASWSVSGLTMAHTHTGPEHTHTLSAHTHTGPSHTHTGPSHTHTLGAHTHTGPSHTHTVTIPISGYGGSAAGGIQSGYMQTDNSGNMYHATEQPTATSAASGTGNTGAPSSDATGAEGTGATGAAGTGATGTPSSDATSSSGTGNTGAASSSTVSSSGVWRPKASIGKLFQLDTA